jgi:hypothetical protein
MPDPAPEPGDRFPFATAIATLLTLFLFFGLVLVVYNSPNYLGEVPAEPELDPATKLQNVKARNQAVLDGTDPATKMSAAKATADVIARTSRTKDDKHKYGTLPFPVAPKASPPAEKKP